MQFHILAHSGVAPQISLVETTSPNMNQPSYSGSLRNALQNETENWRNDSRKRVQQVDCMFHLNSTSSTRRRLEPKSPARMQQLSWVSASSACRPNSFSLVIVDDKTLPEGVGVATRVGSQQAGGHNLSKKQTRLRRLQDGQRATQRPRSAPPMATGFFVRSDEQAMASVLHDLGAQQPPTQKALYNFPRRQTLSVPQTPESHSRCIREGLTSRHRLLLQARQNRHRESNGKDVVGYTESKGRDVVGITMKHTAIINVSPFANASVLQSTNEPSTSTEPSTSVQKTIHKPDIYANEIANINFNHDTAARAQTHGRVRPRPHQTAGKVPRVMDTMAVEGKYVGPKRLTLHSEMELAATGMEGGGGGGGGGGGEGGEGGGGRGGEVKTRARPHSAHPSLLQDIRQRVREREGESTFVRPSVRPSTAAEGRYKGRSGSPTSMLQSMLRSPSPSASSAYPYHQQRTETSCISLRIPQASYSPIQFCVIVLTFRYKIIQYSVNIIVFHRPIIRRYKSTPS